MSLWGLSAALRPTAILQRLALPALDEPPLGAKNLRLLAGLLFPGAAACILGRPLLLRLTDWTGLPAPSRVAALVTATLLSVLVWTGWLLLKAGLRREYRALALSSVNEELVTTILELKQSGRALKLAASFPDQSPNPILRISSRGRILYANKSGEPILTAWSRETGGTAPDFWTGLVGSALARGDRVVEAESGGRHYSVLLWPMPEMGYVNLYWFDVTARKKAERQLELAGSVLETTHEGIAIADHRGMILQVNPAFEVLTGFPAQEIVGRPLRLTDPEHRRPEEIEEFWTEIHSQDRWQGEVWNRHKNGEAYPEWQTVSLIRDSKGKPTHLVSVFSDISPVVETREETRRLAYHDALTGLPNRLLFGDRLEVALRQVRRKSGRLALLFLDLDRFKDVNDRLGHDMGDRLLGEVARRLGSAFREEDTVARLGGDEFIVLLRDIKSPQEAGEMATKIIEALACPFHLKDCRLQVTASIGVAFYPDHGSTAQELIKNADKAMYRAKRMGRNNLQIFCPDSGPETGPPGGDGPDPFQD